jgi:hypothetical protein
MPKRVSKRKPSTARVLWLAGLGVIAVGYRHGRRVLDRAIAAGKVSAHLAREIAIDFRAHLSGVGDMAVEATHLRKH